MTHRDENSINPAGMSRTEWLAHLGRIGADHGFFDRISPHHLGLFVQEGSTLVVSFDDADTVFHQRAGGLPLGFSAVQARQVSLLSVMAEGQTWFRDPDLFAFFDTLRAQGFFESFEKVVFLGVGPMAGHAACSYASAAPGATVIAARPAVTQGGAVAGFDDRFPAARRRDFTSAYGDAVDLTRDAAPVLLFYDPCAATDAAHAAQFRGDHIMRLPLRFLGAHIDTIVSSDRLLVPILRSIEAGDLTRQRTLEFLRPVRRSHAAGLLHLTLRAARAGQARRTAVLAQAARAADLQTPYPRRNGPRETAAQAGQGAVAATAAAE